MTSVRARALRAMLRAGKARGRFDGIVDAAGAATSAPPGRSVTRVATVSHTDAGGRAVWRLVPRSPRPDAPMVLFLHGGAYVAGFSPLHWSFLARLMNRTGACVVAPDYPLAPTSTVEQVLPWTLGRYSALIDEGRPVVVMGDSAGGGLALSLTVAARAERMRPPRHLVLLSPWLDVGMTAREAVPFDAADVFLTRDGLIRAGRQYAGAAGTADWRASPLFADLAGLPATTVLAGTADQLVLDARRLGSRAMAAGSPVVVHEVPGMVHDWVLFGLVPEARAALDLVVECVLG